MLESLPFALPYIKLLAVFTLMMLGVRYKLGLGLSALIGSFVLALLFGLPVTRWIELGVDIFYDRSILTVWAVVVLVLTMSSLMEQTGQAQRFMAAFSCKITSPLVRMVFFPILIGLLPMPGGAVFSAPMISAVTQDMPLQEEDKSCINYWFRHSAELCWPLFPSVILAAGMAQMPTPSLLLWTAPMTLVFLFCGWFFFVRGIHVEATQTQTNAAHGTWGTILYQGAPIFIALAGALVFEVLFALFIPERPMDEGVLVALTLAVIVCMVQNSLGIKALASTLIKPSVRSMLLIVGALGVFKNVLVGGDVVSILLSQGSGDATLWLTATILPLLVGALTGLLMACVGSVFPLLILLAQSIDGGGHVAQWMTLALISGLAGAMASPLHICFVLSCTYFKVDIIHSWRRLPLPCLVFMGCGLLYFFIILKV